MAPINVKRRSLISVELLITASVYCALIRRSTRRAYTHYPGFLPFRPWATSRGPLLSSPRTQVVGQGTGFRYCSSSESPNLFTDSPSEERNW
ncbi:hypothetical protein BD289DRAFT_231650 [Coniella lustricola]|uniref:Uncharacterized protein n=1 Tax=Coniella lustricola TaxID=2025994 RepID=A0A2T3AA68_9PEZI|nr:hypothetical protein BD289DRAFT_231650 [Coniella lustricola]